MAGFFRPDLEPIMNECCGRQAGAGDFPCESRRHVKGEVDCVEFDMGERVQSGGACRQARTKTLALLENTKPGQPRDSRLADRVARLKCVGRIQFLTSQEWASTSSPSHLR